ncbi:MAG: M16 family metallopeptidase [Vicinamibacterales bacterium]
MTVRAVEHRGVPVSVFAVLLPGGAAEDPAGRHGLAALTGDMLDEGAGEMDAIEIQAALDRVGASLDIEVGSDHTLIVLTVLTRFAKEALRLARDVVTRPRFDEVDFERVRHLRLNRLLQLRDLPPSLADRAFFQALYGEHPYGHMPLGTEEGLRATGLDDLTALHRRVFRPERATLIAVGDADEEQLFEQATEAFGEWAGDTGVPFASIEQGVSLPLGDRRRLVVVDRPGSPQSELRIGHLGLARATPDYHAVIVLNAVLGGQFTSRLNLKLREEKGFTYGARSAFEFRRQKGPFIVQVAVESRVTAEATADIFAEIEAIRGIRPVSEEELDLARAALTRGYPRSFETAEQVARALAQMVLYDLPEDCFDRFIPEIEAVDCAEVTRVAEAHLFPSRLLTAIVGDWQRAAVEVTRLGLTPELPGLRF